MIFLQILARGLLHIQAAIDRLTGFPFPLGFGVDLSVTAASVLASTGGAAQIRSEYKAGATVTAGQAVYLGAANTWLLIDTNAAVTGNATADQRGIALNAAASGQPMSVCVGDTTFTPGATLTNGSTVYASTTAGAITHDVPASGAYPTILGVAKSATTMVLQPVASGVVI